MLCDEAEIRPGFPLKVTAATFDDKYGSDGKPKKKQPKKKLYDQAQYVTSSLW
jgi:hypothetical protein